MSDFLRPELYARHLLVCHQVLYDPFQPGRGIFASWLDR